MPSDEVPQNGGMEETRDWSDTLPYEGDSEISVPELGTESEHWSRWHYGIYTGTALIFIGAISGPLLFLVVGYFLIPIAMYLDSGYIESVTPGWHRDSGLYVLGSLFFPMLLVPAYLYRRRELRRTE
jgi:hypothetical protein